LGLLFDADGFGDSVGMIRALLAGGGIVRRGVSSVGDVPPLAATWLLSGQAQVLFQLLDEMEARAAEAEAWGTRSAKYRRRQGFVTAMSTTTDVLQLFRTFQKLVTWEGNNRDDDDHGGLGGGDGGGGEAGQEDQWGEEEEDPEVTVGLREGFVARLLDGLETAMRDEIVTGSLVNVRMLGMLWEKAASWTVELATARAVLDEKNEQDALAALLEEVDERSRLQQVLLSAAPSVAGVADGSRWEMLASTIKAQRVALVARPSDGRRHR